MTYTDIVNTCMAIAALNAKKDFALKFTNVPPEEMNKLVTNHKVSKIDTFDGEIFITVIAGIKVEIV